MIAIMRLEPEVKLKIHTAFAVHPEVKISFDRNHSVVRFHNPILEWAAGKHTDLPNPTRIPHNSHVHADFGVITPKNSVILCGVNQALFEKAHVSYQAMGGISEDFQLRMLISPIVPINLEDYEWLMQLSLLQ